MDETERKRAASNRLVRGLVGGVAVGGVIWIAGGVAGPHLRTGFQELIQGLAFFAGLVTAVIIVRVSQARQS